MDSSYTVDQEKVVVTTQPKGLAFETPVNMRATGPCPAGLEYIQAVDQLLIKQQVELLEVLTGCETKNKYRIYNNMGQQVYYAKEETECLMRICCGVNRGFSISITDNYNKEVMKVSREFKCCAGCSWCASADCCAYVVKVEAPVGNVVGYVRQMGSFWKPVLGIYDANFEQTAFIRGPCCVCNCPCCGDVEFPVTTLPDNMGTETKFGMCAKQWTGALLEIFTDADTFNVRFPIDLDPKAKATMLGAIFLIDFMFFESEDEGN